MEKNRGIPRLCYIILIHSYNTLLCHTLTLFSHNNYYFYISFIIIMATADTFSLQCNQLRTKIINTINKRATEGNINIIELHKQIQGFSVNTENGFLGTIHFTHVDFTNEYCIGETNDTDGLHVAFEDTDTETLLGILTILEKEEYILF